MFDIETTKHKNILLHFMGAETYNTLCDKISPEKAKNKTYDEIVTSLKEHFEPEPLEIVENYKFHLRKQTEHESCNEFMVALKKLSTHCNFGTYRETALRNQFVFGLRNNRIQNRLLEVKALTVTAALEKANAMELSEKGGAEINVKTTENINLVKIKEKKRPYKPPNDNTRNNSNILFNKLKGRCYRCGEQEHRADQCQYKEVKCAFCSKVGHLKRVCLKVQQLNQSNVHQIEEGDNDEQTVEDILQIIETAKNGLRSKLFCNLNVNNCSLIFEIDTGAPVTVVSLTDARKFFAKSTVKKSDTELESYCGKRIKCYGYIYVDVQLGASRIKKLKMYIVDSNRAPLLGREWLRQIQMDWKSIVKGNLNAVSLLDEQSTSKKLEQLMEKYKTLFSKTVGKITGMQARIHIKPNAIPEFIKARKLPFPLINPVENELDNMEKEGIVKRVETSDWASPIVPVRKSNGDVRICGDYKTTINKYINIDEYPLPTIDELFSSVAGGDKHTKIDLNKAYLHMEVHPDDRKYLTLSTHRGLYEPQRLMFGVSCAAAKFQNEMEKALKNIPGVKVFQDDIRITASDDETHLQRLETVFERLSQYNLRINHEKSEFMADEITYCGYIIDKNGIRKMKEKIDAIQNMPQPKSKDEVRSFIGLVNYYSRFIQNMSTILYPMNNLLKEKVEFVWSNECNKGFNEIKKQMQSDTVLAHYDPKLRIILAVDASPVGVGCVLSHLYPDGTERPVQYASQTLTPTQQKYSQIDREAYAIIFGVKRFYQYLYASKFILVTDNKPLSQILAPTKCLPTLSATRMQHYAIFLASFNYEIRCKRSAENANADAMSRLPIKYQNKNIEEVDVIEVNMIENLPVTTPELGRATQEDESIKNLLHSLKHGRECDAKYRFNIDQNEFALQQDCLMRGIRVYIPSVLREKILNELHTAHFGMTKMKTLARGYCWWNGMDQDIENMVSNCSSCQKVRPEPRKNNPTHCWEQPKSAFDRVHADFMGPYMGKYFFVLVDAYSKWPEVHVLPNITTETTIRKCREIFATFGLPVVFVSDHGVQFTSHEFQAFLKANGIIHKQGAPYHPSTNGQAERYVQTIKNKIKAINCNKNDIEKELSKVLMAYRRAEHPVTGRSPAMMLFNRQIRSRLDIMMPDNNSNNKNIPKPVERTVEINERVAVRNYLSKEKWMFGKVIEKLGSLHYMIKLDDNRIWKRHIEQIRRIGQNVEVEEDCDNNFDTDSDIPGLVNGAISTDGNETTTGNELPTEVANDTVASNTSAVPIITQHRGSPGSTGRKSVTAVPDRGIGISLGKQSRTIRPVIRFRDEYDKYYN